MKLYIFLSLSAFILLFSHFVHFERVKNLSKNDTYIHYRKSGERFFSLYLRLFLGISILSSRNLVAAI